MNGMIQPIYKYEGSLKTVTVGRSNEDHGTQCNENSTTVVLEEELRLRISRTVGAMYAHALQLYG